jgi:membrane protein
VSGIGDEVTEINSKSPAPQGASAPDVSSQEDALAERKGADRIDSGGVVIGLDAGAGSDAGKGAAERRQVNRDEANRGGVNRDADHDVHRDMDTVAETGVHRPMALGPGALSAYDPARTATPLRYAPSFFGIVRGMVTQTYRRGVEIELLHRAFGFAAMGFVTLVPLLIVVAAAAPLNGRTFPEWAIAGLGLSGHAASAVNHLFGPTNRVLSTTTAFSLAVLAIFGLSFGAVVQTGMARVWELPAARLMSVWRQAIWLAVLVGLLLVGADLVALLHDGWFITTLRWTATAGGATLFFWWTPRFLLEGRVPWLALLPGAIFTVIGLVGLRLFSAVIFSPLLVSSAITYGAIGAVLILVTWLIGIGYVIFGAALIGRVGYEAWQGGSRESWRAKVKVKRR